MPWIEALPCRSSSGWNTSLDVQDDTPVDCFGYGTFYPFDIQPLKAPGLILVGPATTSRNCPSRWCWPFSCQSLSIPPPLSWQGPGKGGRHHHIQRGDCRLIVSSAGLGDGGCFTGALRQAGVYEAGVPGRPTTTDGVGHEGPGVERPDAAVLCVRAKSFP